MRSSRVLELTDKLALEAAARRLGCPIQKIGPVTVIVLGVDGDEPELGPDTRELREAFAAAQRAESGR